MKIGFTGTQHGMTEAQRSSVKIILLRYKDAEFHHGDCIGADAEAHDIAVGLGLQPVIHPPLNSQKRAWKDASKIYMTQSYIDRNHAIVKATDLLIAVPRGYREELRSGTWATVRFAKGRHKPVYFVWPLGEIDYEET